MELLLKTLSKKEIKEREKREIDSMKRYYEGQIGLIDFHSEYPARVKFEGKNSTKWMDMNETSAEIIVKDLIKQFKLKIK
jgi:hypothetical protein